MAGVTDAATTEAKKPVPFRASETNWATDATVETVCVNGRILGRIVRKQAHPSEAAAPAKSRAAQPKKSTSEKGWRAFQISRRSTRSTDNILDRNIICMIYASLAATIYIDHTPIY